MTDKIATIVLSLSLLSASQFCYGEDKTHYLNGSFSTQLTLASDYVFRGESETVDGNIPALQFATTWTHQSGWYLGLFGSSNKFESAPQVDTVVGPYLGKSGKIGSTDINYNAFVFHYVYPGVSELNYTELWLKADKQMGDINIGVELTPTLNDWFGVAGYRGINYALHGSYNLSKNLKINGSFGYQALSGPGAQGWQHYNIGLSYRFQKLTFDLRYHDANITASHKVYGSPAGLKIFDPRIVMGVSISF